MTGRGRYLNGKLPGPWTSGIRGGLGRGSQGSKPADKAGRLAEELHDVLWGEKAERLAAGITRDDVGELKCEK